MFRKLRELLLKHIQGNVVIYFIVILFFVVGISSGAFTVKALSDQHKGELISYMQNFFQVLNQSTFDAFSVLKQSLVNNLQTGILTWILGVTIIGIPLILLIIVIRGFIIGFTVGFLIEQMGIKGFLFCVFAILPQNLFIIPGIIIIAVIAVSFSVMLIKSKLNKNYQVDMVRQFVLYSTIVAAVFLVILLGSFIEAYITPIFMRFISQYM
ncbi:stage II sporulation protein M [Geosporobacter subterraneus DSM 17957]|uniref:Stage II sporulation protein M n=1 Tax=Geosporobacter subterraneus DSM 17957 TaxID=1121919 RepID=A0A1M6C5M0_9FIRM|nr:stage II sporulation protein M [Geosporobacter subterraneus]SHI56320.1 stage II sporulation protein M [Geosporobacter subterraneus DSM 17957]